MLTGYDPNGIGSLSGSSLLVYPAKRADTFKTFRTPLSRSLRFSRPSITRTASQLLIGIVGANETQQEKCHSHGTARFEKGRYAE